MSSRVSLLWLLSSGLQVKNVRGALYCEENESLAETGPVSLNRNSERIPCSLLRGASIRRDGERSYRKAKVFWRRETQSNGPSSQGFRCTEQLRGSLMQNCPSSRSDTRGPHLKEALSGLSGARP